MHVWLINSLIEKEIFETLFRPDYLQKAVCIVVVDLYKVNPFNAAVGDNRKPEEMVHLHIR